MDLHVGTSGYSYKEWKDSFYPADLPADQMLRYYSGRFGTVEINNTFYRMPKTSVIESWAGEVGPGFRFVIKASQRITHYKRLKEADDVLGYLLRAGAALGDRLGALLFQLPPNMKKDVPRLRDFLTLLPPRQPRAAFEFRHASWFDEEVFDALRDHQVALCFAEQEEGLEVPFVSTADWGYLRLRNADYGDAELKAWADRIAAQGWREAFVFFKHEDEARGPAMASRFLELARGAPAPTP